MAVHPNAILKDIRERLAGLNAGEAIEDHSEQLIEDIEEIDKLAAWGVLPDEWAKHWRPAVLENPTPEQMEARQAQLSEQEEAYVGHMHGLYMATKREAKAGSLPPGAPSEEIVAALKYAMESIVGYRGFWG
jgi:hypothetical protein